MLCGQINCSTDVRMSSGIHELGRKVYIHAEGWDGIGDRGGCPAVAKLISTSLATGYVFSNSLTDLLARHLHISIGEDRFEGTIPPARTASDERQHTEIRVEVGTMLDASEVRSGGMVLGR